MSPSVETKIIVYRLFDNHGSYNYFIVTSPKTQTDCCPEWTNNTAFFRRFPSKKRPRVYSELNEIVILS